MSNKPILFDQVVEHLTSLGYYHSDFSIYVLDFAQSLGIGLSWHNPDDGGISIQLWDGECANQGQSIRVSTLDFAKALIDNFHTANVYLQELLDRNNLLEETRIGDTLEKYLDRSKYGETWQNLLDEIHSGQCQIEWQNNRPLRRIETVTIDVVAPNGDRLFGHYREAIDGAEQEYQDWGISQPMKSKEAVAVATNRILQSELGIHPRHVMHRILISPTPEVKFEESPTYPGLMTKQVHHYVKVYLDPSAVRPQYIESQEGKTIVFSWQTPEPTLQK